MYKPGNLRAFLVAAIPELARDPDRLSIYIDRGSLRASMAPGLSWEYAYTLNLILTDFAGDPDAVMAPVIDWMRVQQPDTMANPDLAERAISFEADILNNDAVDLAITLELTERAICRARKDAGYDVTHPPEPQPEPRLDSPRHWQLYVKDELVAEWDQPAP
jgi:hypothetical protein